MVSDALDLHCLLLSLNYCLEAKQTNFHELQLGRQVQGVCFDEYAIIRSLFLYKREMVSRASGQPHRSSNTLYDTLEQIFALKVMVCLPCSQKDAYTHFSIEATSHIAKVKCIVAMTRLRMLQGPIALGGNCQAMWPLSHSPRQNAWFSKKYDFHLLEHNDRTGCRLGIWQVRFLSGDYEESVAEQYQKVMSRPWFIFPGVGEEQGLSGVVGSPSMMHLLTIIKI